jgi:peptidoglycan-associated lipoprotein
MSQYKVLTLMLAFFALAACGGNSTVPDPEMTDTAGSADTQDGYGDDGAYGNDGGAALDDDLMGITELSHTIYFDFDSSEVRAADTDTVAGHATMMTGNGGLSVRLEGHADERGSREYNIGLGERRAQAVRRMLLLQGVSAAQISTVSFGEERPANSGSNESAYAQNRRVEITYTN